MVAVKDVEPICSGLTNNSRRYHQSAQEKEKICIPVIKQVCQKRLHKHGLPLFIKHDIAICIKPLDYNDAKTNKTDAEEKGNPRRQKAKIGCFVSGAWCHI